LIFKRFFVLLVIVCTITVTCIAATGQQSKIIDVSVSGLEGVLLTNVLSALSLVQQQSNKRMTENMVRRSYDNADEEIQKSLEPFGYYLPTIKKDIRQENNVWHVELEVNPGEPVRIIEIDIRFTGQGNDDEQLREVISGLPFPLNVGDVLDHNLYEKGKKALTSAIIASGYRDVFFKKRIVNVNKKQLSAQIYLVIDTGPQYLFGSTTFAADFLSESLLHRMLPYSEGDSFSPRKIIKLRQALLNSDYFNTVDVKTGDTAPGSLSVPVLISLSPRNPNKYGLGIGYGTDTGARGSLKWTNRRVNRYGHQFNLQLQPSERKSSFGGVYTIPIYDPHKDRLALLGKWENEYFETTETISRQASIAYDHVGEMLDYSPYLAFLDEDYDVSQRTGHATLLMPGIKSTWRLADNRLKTKNGVRVAINLTGSNENIVSDISFFQASLNSKAILTFFEQWRIIGRFQLGATLVDNVFDLPPSLRFYAGGDQSVRGYAYKSIGPTDPAGDVLGGSHLITYSLELERELFDNWSAALFFDSGDATDSFDDLNMKNGAGIGIRWNAPFGQVRLDVANAVSENNNSWRIHFNVGADL
jgi:translocation and assembly module TamA